MCPASKRHESHRHRQACPRAPGAQPSQAAMGLVLAFAAMPAVNRLRPHRLAATR
jgi:hypothetical protein